MFCCQDHFDDHFSPAVSLDYFKPLCESQPSLHCALLPVTGELWIKEAVVKSNEYLIHQCEGFPPNRVTTTDSATTDSDCDESWQKEDLLETDSSAAEAGLECELSQRNSICLDNSLGQSSGGYCEFEGNEPSNLPSAFTRQSLASLEHLESTMSGDYIPDTNKGSIESKNDFELSSPTTMSMESLELDMDTPPASPLQTESSEQCPLSPEHRFLELESHRTASSLNSSSTKGYVGYTHEKDKLNSMYNSTSLGASRLSLNSTQLAASPVTSLGNEIEIVFDFGTSSSGFEQYPNAESAYTAAEQSTHCNASAHHDQQSTPPLFSGPTVFRHDNTPLHNEPAQDEIQSIHDTATEVVGFEFKEAPTFNTELDFETTQTMAFMKPIEAPVGDFAGVHVDFTTEASRTELTSDQFDLAVAESKPDTKTPHNFTKPLFLSPSNFDIINKHTASMNTGNFAVDLEGLEQYSDAENGYIETPTINCPPFEMPSRDLSCDESTDFSDVENPAFPFSPLPQSDDHHEDEGDMDFGTSDIFFRDNLTSDHLPSAMNTSSSLSCSTGSSGGYVLGQSAFQLMPAFQAS